MGTKEEVQNMRKRNMKLFPIYKMLSWDLLFYYGINFLFLTQVKNISAADVVLKDTFYALFYMVVGIPVNIIIAFFGRKNSIVLGNIFNTISICITIFSRNIYDLIFAEFISAIAFALKDTVHPVLLKESIPPSRYKNKIFAKLNARGATAFYILSTISKIIAGYLFTINGYLPMILTLMTSFISTGMAMLFIEPVENKKNGFNKTLGVYEIKNIKSGFIFVLKSERLKALLISAALICALLSILTNYEVNLLEDIKLSSIGIGIAGAAFSLISALAAKLESKFNSRFRNKSITIMSLMLSISALLAGICGILPIKETIIGIGFILILYLVFGFVNGIYYTIIDRYLTNFTNKEIDTKIISVYNLFRNVVRVLFGFFASFLLGKMTSAYALIVIGLLFTIIFIVISKYMKSRLGLKPEEYSKEERKYDELKESINA